MPTVKDVYIDRATEELPEPTEEEMLDETVNAIDTHMLGDCDDVEPCLACQASMQSLAEERRANP